MATHSFFQGQTQIFDYSLTICLLGRYSLLGLRYSFFYLFVNLFFICSFVFEYRCTSKYNLSAHSCTIFILFRASYNKHLCRFIIYPCNTKSQWASSPPAWVILFNNGLCLLKMSIFCIALATVIKQTSRKSSFVPYVPYVTVWTIYVFVYIGG